MLALPFERHNAGSPSISSSGWPRCYGKSGKIEGAVAPSPRRCKRGIAIERPNQVWSTDITYIPMQGGFLYLVAVMDWFSRFVLSWELSNTMEVGFCLAALEAFRFGQPEIWNSDQGA